MCCHQNSKSFFKENFITEARIPTGASFMWKSIAKARELLKQGIRWRIGDGRQVKVWKDGWLLTPFVKVICVEFT